MLIADRLKVQSAVYDTVKKSLIILETIKLPYESSAVDVLITGTREIQKF